MIDTLVIGCGNPLRGDDALGPSTAEIIADWRLPGVKVIIVHQLTPELIDEIATAARVLFIDAALSSEPFAFELLTPSASRRTLGHHETPGGLLMLLQSLEGRTPPAWLLSIRAQSFEHGAALTEAAQAARDAALARARDWLTRSD